MPGQDYDASTRPRRRNTAAGWNRAGGRGRSIMASQPGKGRAGYLGLAGVQSLSRHRVRRVLAVMGSLQENDRRVRQTETKEA